MALKSRRRVVFDCNLFLQAVGRGGNHAYGCLSFVLDEKVTLCMSTPCLSEIDEVLRRSELKTVFPMLDDERVNGIIDIVREISEFFDPVQVAFPYPRDPKDEPWINLAIKASADYLVSWDNDILDLGGKSARDAEAIKVL